MPPISEVASPERGDIDVDARAGRDKGRQVGGDEHRGDIERAHVAVAADIDAQAVEHGLQRLLGEGGIAQRIAGVLQADDKAIADELIVADALQRRDVLDAHDRVRTGSSPDTARDEGETQHQPPTRTDPSA